MHGASLLAVSCAAHIPVPAYEMVDVCVEHLPLRILHWYAHRLCLHHLAWIYAGARAWLWCRTNIRNVLKFSCRQLVCSCSIWGSLKLISNGWQIFKNSAQNSSNLRDQFPNTSWNNNASPGILRPFISRSKDLHIVRDLNPSGACILQEKICTGAIGA